ncbi:adenylate kinase-like kinase [Serratia sp. SCBI]|nr:adenylate kinase-like kinase [Serratia sp. SCBI]
MLDGNYSRTQPIKWREVDYILWLDYGFGRTLWQAVRRACRRAAGKKRAVAGHRQSGKLPPFFLQPRVDRALDDPHLLEEPAKISGGDGSSRRRTPFRAPAFSPPGRRFSTGAAAGSQQQTVMDPHHRFLDLLWTLPHAAGLVRLHLEKEGEHAVRHVQRLRVAFDVQQQQIAIFRVGVFAMSVARQTVFDALFTADQQMQRNVFLMHFGALFRRRRGGQRHHVHKDVVAVDRVMPQRQFWQVASAQFGQG